MLTEVLDELRSKERSLLEVARRYYYAPDADTDDELEGDLYRIKFIKRLITKYRKQGDLKDRLLLNHLIVLFNVFEPTFCRTLLRHSMSDPEWTVINSCLVALGRSLDTVTTDPDLLRRFKNLLKVGTV